MINCSMYAGVQCTQVFNLTGSTVYIYIYIYIYIYMYMYVYVYVCVCLFVCVCVCVCHLIIHYRLNKVLIRV